MKHLFFIALILNGCGTHNDTDSKYESLCDRQPDSVSCTQHEETNLIPSYKDVYYSQFEMYDNFTYKTDKEKYGVEDYWFDGEVSNVKLEGDCEDISLTFISQNILDGYNPANFRLVMSGNNGIIYHSYVQVKTSDGTIFNFYKDYQYEDIEYMQYDNIGAFIR